MKKWIDSLLFFPSKEVKNTPQSIEIAYEDVYVYDELLRYHGWFINGNRSSFITEDKCILFLHGNAGNIGNRLHYIESFYEMGFTLLFIDYPGFGYSQGVPTEESCVECSSLFYQYLIEEKDIQKENIILYGESIGGSIASSMALQCKPKYLIIQSSFTEIKDLFFFLKIDIGFYTLEHLKKRYKLNQKDKKMRTMIIHSSEDEVIDVKNGEQLGQFADKLYITKGKHSSIEINNHFIYELLTFLQ
jgi:pimeloyl-ACP methyl ester carboxylesterase